MTDGRDQQVSNDNDSKPSFIKAPPGISLPKGGGAIRGLGEKFAANPVTGTGSMTVPIQLSPGRSGFTPQLSLSYDSGEGNGPFGLGWKLSLPSITRKTDKGLPAYRDDQESDVFILSEAEDLVPVGDAFEDPSHQYQIQRYQPRVEGMFARIERWSNKQDAVDVFWRTISGNNVTSFFGKTAESRIADPATPSHIFSWLICATYDDKGNCNVYEYLPENETNVDLSHANERNRTRTANRYLRLVKYGNTPSHLAPNFETTAVWHFELLFDYGDGMYREDFPDNAGNIYAHVKSQPASHTPAIDWPSRKDAYSSYRSGFEVRTYRLCQRILMFHSFDELLHGDAQLVGSTEIIYEADPVVTRTISMAHCSFLPYSGATDTAGERRYLKKSLPPLEFKYSEPVIDGTIRDVDQDSLENLPCGLGAEKYQWVDLDGEGLSGILADFDGGWFYKRNLGPINLERDADGSEHARAKFAPVEAVAAKPNTPITEGAQFMDLAGDGQLDLVTLVGQTQGFYERNDDEGWEQFRPFSSQLNRNARDLNLRFIDLDGDGHADVLITEDEALTWHSSLGEDGFGAAQRVLQSRDEETGPALLFADGTQSIYLADMSGDGLTDLVRIRNGDVCYWPNLGYGRFGAKVTMDNAPLFDAQDQFDQRRVHLADLDGSGLTDIVYVHGDDIKLYFNESGNNWSHRRVLPGLPAPENLSDISVVDLLGNGTACLVWSSSLASNSRRPMKYVDLMSGQKPHMLIAVSNNLGASTTVEYVPSTRFYLEDKLGGNPWITRLPFPVHCVSKVTVEDEWKKTKFTTTYSYHHGYFDGVEREFRGFGRVEQVDCEDYGTFFEGSVASPYISDDQRLYQPPVKTITWYHTGAAIDRERILGQFNKEYFPQRFAHRLPDPSHSPNAFSEQVLPEPELPGQLNSDEWREALRACKGMMLRQEIYELDVDDLAAERSKHTAVRLFSAAVDNCHIQMLQARGKNRHAIFLVTKSEVITYQYDLTLSGDNTPLEPDPRITHTLNLKIDQYGNVLESAAVIYLRTLFEGDQSLTSDQLDVIHRVQNKERHLMMNATDYTHDIFTGPKHRLPVPCQSSSWEVTGIVPAKKYFALSELKNKDLMGVGTTEIPYHQTSDGTTPQRRLVECLRFLFFADDLQNHLDFGFQGSLSLPYETYQLALTKNLLDRVLVDPERLQVAYSMLGQQTLGFPASGYYRGDQLFTVNPIASAPLNEQYWLASGRAGFSNTAATQFYWPDRYTDPFGNLTKLTYDGAYDLFLQSSTDARSNSIRVESFNYRVLAPDEIIDINDNHTQVYFDVRGLVVASALKGKQINGEWQGDNLEGFTEDLATPSTAAVVTFCTQPTFNDTQARTWLGNATTRFVYHFGERIDANGKTIWSDRMAGVCGIMRERHASQVAADPQHKNPLQVTLQCSDGAGNILMKKVQAEPDPANGQRRWIVNGLTVLNNKSKPVKQFEPAFSAGFGCERPRANGVCSVTYYDALGRVVRVEMPDGTLNRVEFSPWQVAKYDANDTAYDPDPSKCSDWYLRRTDPTHPRFAEFDNPEDLRAARLVQLHAGTPATTYLDTLARTAINVVHNKYVDRQNVLRNEKYLTFTKFDAEGKPLWIRDARGNLVMQYITPLKPTRFADEVTPAKADDVPINSVPGYDIAGNLLYQHSMDAGDRWTLADAAGKPMMAWDRNEQQTGTTLTPEMRVFRTKYDALHRPIEQWLTIDDGTPQLIERFEYQDTVDSDPNGDAVKNNLRGQLVRHHDSSGLSSLIRIDFKGNTEEIHRTLTSQYKESIVDWQGDDNARALKLEGESFVQINTYDALSRVTQLYNWHRSLRNSRVAVYVPGYSERGVLVSETLDIGATKTSTGHTASGNPLTNAIVEIRYNAKGQKTYLKLGNGSVSRYTYDRENFRLRSLYTHRDARFTDDCGDEPPLPRFAAPDVDSPPRSCGVQNLSYTYDPVGNISHIQDDAQQTIYFQNARVEPSNDYLYDALYRLISTSGREEAQLNAPPPQVDGPPVSTSFPITGQTLRRYTQYYLYDSVGNIEKMEHVANTNGRWTRYYEYATDSNRLLRTWSSDADWDSNNATEKTTYVHDTHGNMLNLAQVAPDQYLRWDYRDMICSLNLVGGGIAYYNYDSSKQRVRKRIDKQNNTNGYWERIYLGGYELYRRYSALNSATPVEEIESHHLFEGEQRVLLVDDVITPGGTANPRPDGLPVKAQTLFRYQYGNHLGSACLELDDQAEIISYEEYHPYGTSSYQAVKSAIEAPPKRYRYTGMERDEESGLNYHGSRYYALSLTRWVSCDPIPTNNLYQFTNSNPILWKDLSGRAPECEGIAGCDLTWEQRIIATRRSFQMDPTDLEGAADLQKWKDERRQANYEAAALNAQKESEQGPSRLSRILNKDLSFGLAGKERELEERALDYLANTGIGRKITGLIETIEGVDPSLKETAGNIGSEALSNTFGGIAASEQRRGATTSISAPKMGEGLGHFSYEGGKTIAVVAATVITPEIEAGSLEAGVSVERTAESYRATDLAVKRIQAVGYLRGGELELLIRTKLPEGTRGALRGGKEFQAILEHFGVENIKVIKGSWSYGDNLAEFNKLLLEGLTEEEAALGTWTGKQAQAVGFGKVRVRTYGSPGDYEKVEAYFTRD